MALVVENANHALANGASSGTISISTGGTNRILTLMIQTEANSASVFPAVTSVSGGGVIWSKTNTKQTSFTSNFTGIANQEVWQAFAAGQLTTQTITVNFDRATDGASLNYIAVGGSFLTSSPFNDPNNSLPANGPNSSSGGPSLTISTTNPNDVIVAWVLEIDGQGAPTAPSGYTSQIAFDDHSPAVWDFGAGISTNIVTATQSGIIVTGGRNDLAGPGGPNAVMMIFAITQGFLPTTRAQSVTIGF